MEKYIQEGLAEICEYAYAKGFKDAVQIAQGLGPDETMECLKEGLEANRKQWEIIAS
jgi:hypothetical protein